MKNNQLKDFFEKNIYPFYLNCQNTIQNITNKILNNNKNNTDNNIDNLDETEYKDEFDEINTEGTIFIFGKKTDEIFAKKKIENIPYFCYRNNFQAPLKNGLYDDIGWGCMIRTGQMMLCYTLCHILKKPKSDIMNYFFDTPEKPFSIHKITEYGEKCHIPVGNWFNPTGIGYTIRNLVADNEDINKLLQVIIGKDGTLYEDEIFLNLKSNKSVLILIPTMLGMEKVNSSYYNSLLKCFETKYNVGVIGGKPKHSFYFIGKRDKNIFFLDPHVIKPALLNIEDESDKFTFQNLFDLKKTISRHFFYDNEDNIINYLDISELDPSMLICFLIKSEDEYKNWKEYVNKNINYDKDISIFSFMNKKDMYGSRYANSNENVDEWVDIS